MCIASSCVPVGLRLIIVGCNTSLLLLARAGIPSKVWLLCRKAAWRRYGHTSFEQTANICQEICPPSIAVPPRLECESVAHQMVCSSIDGWLSSKQKPIPVRASRCGALRPRHPKLSTPHTIKTPSSVSRSCMIQEVFRYSVADSAIHVLHTNLDRPALSLVFPKSGPS